MRVECHAPGCDSRHYSGDHCHVTGTVLEHFGVYNSRGDSIVHQHCRCPACHRGGYGSMYIDECDGPVCGPHCERYSGQTLHSGMVSGPGSAGMPDRTPEGYCPVCGSFSHRGTRHGEMWWTSVKSQHSAETVDALLAKLRSTEAADSDNG